MATSGGGPRVWKARLFTHEDPFNVHKVLGFPCLAHFVVRTLSLPRWPLNDMGFTASPATAAFILMHLCLSCSSLVFKIPAKRIKEGSRIWPEFRLHSIIFACRSLACMSLVWAERRYDPDGYPRYWANVLIVFATLFAADVASSSVSEHSNTIRGLEMSPIYKFSFSYMQFLGEPSMCAALKHCTGATPRFDMACAVEWQALAVASLDCARSPPSSQSSSSSRPTPSL